MTWHPAEGPLGIVNIADESGSAIVSEVRKGHQASYAKVQPGYKLVAVNHTEVIELSVEDIAAFIHGQRKDKPCSISFAIPPAGLRPTFPSPRSPGSMNRIAGMKRDRTIQLKKVFSIFDQDGNKNLDKEELMKIGQARKKLGHASSWSFEQNNALFAALDMNGDGEVEEDEFVTSFEASLPKNEAEFNSIIDEFIEAARVVRGARLASMEDAKAMFQDICAYAGVDGVRQGVPKATLVLCHGGDFGLFEKLDGDSSGDVTLSEWMGYVQRNYKQKARGDNWITSLKHSFQIPSTDPTTEEVEPEKSEGQSTRLLMTSLGSGGPPPRSKGGSIPPIVPLNTTPPTTPDALKAPMDSPREIEPRPEELVAEPGHSHGMITPRVMEEPDAEVEDVPAGISGYLWKKAGGEAGGGSFRLTGRNWKRRWFTLQKGVFAYYAGPRPQSKGEKGFTEGEGKPIWVGSLKTALKNASGGLQCSSGYNGKRTILEVAFRDRVLTMGTAPGDQNKSDKDVLEFWQNTLIAHHRYANAANV